MVVISITIVFVIIIIISIKSVFYNNNNKNNNNNNNNGLYVEITIIYLYCFCHMISTTMTLEVFIAWCVLRNAINMPSYSNHHHGESTSFVNMVSVNGGRLSISRFIWTSLQMFHFGSLPQCRLLTHMLQVIHVLVSSHTSNWHITPISVVRKEGKAGGRTSWDWPCDCLRSYNTSWRIDYRRVSKQQRLHDKWNINDVYTIKPLI